MVSSETTSPFTLPLHTRPLHPPPGPSPQWHGFHPQIRIDPRSTITVLLGRKFHRRAYVARRRIGDRVQLQVSFGRPDFHRYFPPDVLLAGCISRMEGSITTSSNFKCAPVLEVGSSRRTSSGESSLAVTNLTSHFYPTAWPDLQWLLQQG